MNRKLCLVSILFLFILPGLVGFTSVILPTAEAQAVPGRITGAGYSIGLGFIGGDVWNLAVPNPPKIHWSHDGGAAEDPKTEPFNPDGDHPAALTDPVAAWKDRYSYNMPAVSISWSTPYASDGYGMPLGQPSAFRVTQRSEEGNDSIWYRDSLYYFSSSVTMRTFGKVTDIGPGYAPQPAVWNRDHDNWQEWHEADNMYDKVTGKRWPGGNLGFDASGSSTTAHGKGFDFTYPVIAPLFQAAKTGFNVWMYVETILDAGEYASDVYKVAGTSGYEYKLVYDDLWVGMVGAKFADIKGGSVESASAGSYPEDQEAFGQLADPSAEETTEEPEASTAGITEGAHYESTQTRPPSELNGLLQQGIGKSGSVASKSVGSLVELLDLDNTGRPNYQTSYGLQGIQGAKDQAKFNLVGQLNPGVRYTWQKVFYEKAERHRCCWDWICEHCYTSRKHQTAFVPAYQGMFGYDNEYHAVQAQVIDAYLMWIVTFEVHVKQRFVLNETRNEAGFIVDPTGRPEASPLTFVPDIDPYARTLTYNNSPVSKAGFFSQAQKAWDGISRGFGKLLGALGAFIGPLLSAVVMVIVIIVVIVIVIKVVTMKRGERREARGAEERRRYAEMRPEHRPPSYYVPRPPPPGKDGKGGGSG